MRREIKTASIWGYFEENISDDISRIYLRHYLILVPFWPVLLCEFILKKKLNFFH